ncbi:beta subunit of phenylalanyl-tRNA synthetase [Dimargaris cristalligena]|uniref:phenylalanine--tRNA ligase n=1 Tax=Dimargaris cristalligena TaxID=215637 RepID=A0A4P9ZTI5_9FUNG|nr:beta subunit of phenylalanyl-tRNA synthetase [Dimargaris cristalligena]|eukprot:RKP36538.1 beta subunit of phenylalanyl-tRNA synthetase [Dimargaris cristalligena]
MPTVNVDRENLFQALGRDYSTEEFRELCFEFGIELEEDTSVKEMAEKMTGNTATTEALSDRPLLKIDIPANRYDLLCFEGIAQALKVFITGQKPPNFRAVIPKDRPLEKMVVDPSTAQIRPFVACAILRGIRFTQERYDSFIDLQDKLHQNICRKRTLASIGTHDLDTLRGPFSFEALPPKDIRFTPLNQTVEMDGAALMQFYEPDRHLGKYLHIIRDSPVYPVVYDSKRTVCSLPPIINSEHSKITLQTRNVLIECTATDLTKAQTVVHTLVAMFSPYCDVPFTVEPVEVKMPSGATTVFPTMEPRRMTASIDYINSAIGVQLAGPQIVDYLNRMSLPATLLNNSNEVEVHVPVTRSDILHACDLMEDVAIAYGYNNIPKTFPNSSTVAAPFPINKLSDQIRRELALSGFSEIVPLILCSHDENFRFLRRSDPGTEAVLLANPKTVEYQVVRTSLLPGALKTIHQNRKHALPIQVFEVSDVVFKDESEALRARNERHVCAVYCGKTSGFETIHGLLDRLMQMMAISVVAADDTEAIGYFIKEADCSTFFPGRSADIYFRVAPSSGDDTPIETHRIGSFGIIHPEVLTNFEIGYPCSAMEFNLEYFL